MTGIAGKWMLAENDPTLVITQDLDNEGNCQVIADVLVSAGPVQDIQLRHAKAISLLPELIEALGDAETRMTLLYAAINPHANYSDADGSNMGNRNADTDEIITRARSILARLGGVG